MIMTDFELIVGMIFLSWISGFASGILFTTSARSKKR